jgi:hypothetical protein
LEDQYGAYPDNATPKTDLVQNLMYATVWMDGGSMVATWSRLLDTGDATEDNKIMAGPQLMSWGVGTSGVYISHPHNDTYRGWTTVALIPPPACPANLFGCSGNGFCNAAMQRCECNLGFFGPVCSVQTANQPIIFTQASGFSLNYQIDPADPHRIFFRMEVCHVLNS